MPEDLDPEGVRMKAREEFKKRRRQAAKDKAGRSPLPRYVPEVDDVTKKPTGRLRVARPPPPIHKVPRGGPSRHELRAGTYRGRGGG
jgi:hypothetical protein